MTEKKQDKLVFTQSRMAKFLECERKEYFSYQVNGTGLRPATTEEYFIEGELGHYALANWYRTGSESKNKQPLMLRDNMTKRIKELIEEMGALTPEQDDSIRIKLAAMLGACNGYRMVYKDDFKHMKVLAVEEVFEIEVAGVTFKGRLDLVVENDDGVGFMEHKFLQSLSADTWVSLPLNLQQLLYSIAVKSVVGKEAKWYQWNMIKKSQLRRKGMTEGKIPESLLEYESRVQAQYMEEQDKMFFRPPPRLVEPKALERVQQHVAFHLEQFKRIVDSRVLPPMRWSSCSGMYGKPCMYGPACMAESVGHKEGWNAPECQGLYRVKPSQHMELED
jgi:hypothetical protein